MYAYRIPDFNASDGNLGLKSHPVAKRLVIAGPWQFVTHHLGGALATWKGASIKLEDYAAERPTDDGMFYLAPKRQLTPADVARDAISESVPVTFDSGVTIDIPIASRSPIVRRFTKASKFGGYAGEYAKTAYKLYDRIVAKEDILLGDDDLRRMIFLAVASNYRVTEEVLDDLEWLTTADDSKITEVAFGHGPKSSPAAEAT